MERVVPLLAEHSFDLRRIFVGSGSHDGSAVAAAAIVRGLEEAGVHVTHATGMEGRAEQAEALARRLAGEEASLALAVGGGRVIDTVKYAAAQAQVAFVSVPTTIAHDGISSPVASLVASDGHRRSYAASMPAGIIMDMLVVAAAPPRTVRAGIGDLVSNLTAVLDWKLAATAGRERFDAYPAMIAESAASSILDLRDADSPESIERIAKGLLMSGLAMAAAGTSRPCSGAEHLVSHALDEQLGARAAMHGEQVALGTLVAAAAHRSPLLGQLSALYARVGLPVSPADLSISSPEMVAAVRSAPATRPDRYTVLSERDLSAPAVEALLGDAFSAAA